MTTQPGYAQALSPDSTRSLTLQGGAMPLPECGAFLARPRAHDALQLRIWDDRAKDPDPGLQPESSARALAELSAAMRAARSGHR